MKTVDPKYDLFRIISEHAITRGNFILASGARSNYYIDCRKISMTVNGMRSIGLSIDNYIDSMYIHAVGGPEVAVIPMICSIIYERYKLHEKELKGFYTRKKVKDHGTRSLIEGYRPTCVDRVLICDDVITSGESVVDSAKIVLDAGAKVCAITCLVDRLAGAKELIAEELNIPYLPLFTIKDFGL